MALITRCEKLGLVERSVSPHDKRQVEIRLSRKGEECLERLARLHRAELLSLQGKFTVPDIRSFSGED